MSSCLLNVWTLKHILPWLFCIRTDSGIFCVLDSHLFLVNFESNRAAVRRCGIQSRADSEILGHDLDCGHIVSGGYCFLSSGSLSDLIKKGG